MARQGTDRLKQSQSLCPAHRGVKLPRGRFLAEGFLRKERVPPSRSWTEAPCPLVCQGLLRPRLAPLPPLSLRCRRLFGAHSLGIRGAVLLGRAGLELHMLGHHVHLGAVLPSGSSQRSCLRRPTTRTRALGQVLLADLRRRSTPSRRSMRPPPAVPPLLVVAVAGDREVAERRALGGVADLSILHGGGSLREASDHC